MRTKAKIAASALLAAALIAGCSPQGGTAAVVNGERVAVSDVDDGMALGPFFTQQPAPRNILISLIQAQSVIEAASEHGLGVSAQEASAYLDAIGANEIRVDGEYSDSVLDIIRMELISQDLQMAPAGMDVVEAVTEFMTTANIELNPRYGTWDIDQGGLVSGLPEWIERAG